MLEERLQEKILATIDELALIQGQVYRETNADRREWLNDEYVDKRDILRLLLSIQIVDRGERNVVLDYICDRIGRKAWRYYVTEVETRD